MTKTAEQLIEEGETIAREFTEKVKATQAAFEADCDTFINAVRAADISDAAKSSIANGFLNRMVKVQRELSE